MKSSKKLRRATKSNNGHQSWKNQNGQEKTKTSNEGHKKSKWKPGFILRAAQALTDLFEHILNTCTVLNCVSVLKFDILQYKWTLS